PAGHPVAISLSRYGSERRQSIGGVPVHPAALFLKGLRSVPMEDRDHGRDAGREELIDQPIVEIETLHVWRAVPVRLDARPGQREPIGRDAKFFDQRYVLGHPMVVVASDIGALAIHDIAG